MVKSRETSKIAEKETRILLYGERDSPAHQLRQYQQEATQFLLSHRRCILADPPGAGKTPTTLTALEAAGPGRILCVTPKSVLSHWIREAGRWFPNLQVVPGWGPAEVRRRARDQIREIPSQPQMLLMNYEAMRCDVNQLADITFGALIFDEAHRLKSRNTQVTRAARRLVHHPRTWIWMLTGTPIPNRPTEIWSLLHIIDRHRWSSYWRWVDRYCEIDLVRYRQQRFATRVVSGLKDGAVERIRAELGDVLIQRDLDELLPDLPEATVVPVFVDLDAEERRIYREMTKRAWSVLEDGTLLQSVNEVSKQTRLRQVVSSLEALVEREEMGSKVAAAVDLCADLEPEQVVVLTWSRSAAERVARETGGAFIHGEVTFKDRARIMADFTSGAIRVLAGTLATLGEGVDGLQVARILVRLDRDWVPARNDQAVARLRRSGQRSSVLVYDLIARDTLDEVVEKALRNKQDVIDAVLNLVPPT